jgi:hypothetical protein
MPGPPAKHTSVRARANKASTRATLEERDAEDVEIPVLPTHYEYYNDPATGRRRRVKKSWNEMTVDWWNDIWPTPMAAEWHPSDIHGLYRLAGLMDDYWCATSLGERIKAQAEIRLSGRPYGLDPLARRSLEWTFENVEKVKRENRRATVKEQASAPLAPGVEADIRLHVV